MRNRITLFLAMTFLLAATASAAPASLAGNSYSGLYVFGDSLSDVGNFAANSGLPVAPYFNGHFSNGPTWVQTLATQLGVSQTTASELGGGNNYAWGSARYAVDVVTPFGFTIPSLVSQSQQYLNSVGNVADSGGLYVIWGGGNDVFQNDVSDNADALATIVNNLQAAGATEFLIPNLPDIGATPGAGLDAIAQTALSLAHNASLEAMIANLTTQFPQITIHFFDVFALFADVIDDPASYGVSNVTDACYVGPSIGGGTACANPDDYLFWDGVHPTAVAHQVLGTVVPIPAALPLMFAGLAVFGFFRRRAT